MSFTEKFTAVSFKIGNQIHLRTLKDAFAVIMPVSILGGLAVLLNNIIFPLVASGANLDVLKQFGNLLLSGSLNVITLLICPVIAYLMAQNREYESPIVASVVALGCMIVALPTVVSLKPIGADEAVNVASVISYDSLGTKGLFIGIIIGLFATELFVYLSRFSKLQINLGEDVPPMVAQSFMSLIPFSLTVGVFAILSTILLTVVHMDLSTVIVTLIQEPLRSVNTSLPGFLLIYSLGNLLFGFGIHQNVVNGTILRPFLLQNINENALAFNSGAPIPYIITDQLKQVFAQAGGTGMTLALIIAILLFSKSKSSKSIAKVSLIPGLFNINEPLIFGLPIVFNLPLIIPFVLVPVVNLLISYFVTAIGLMDPTVILAPWTTPPLINAYLSAAGDLRAVVVQALLLVIDVFIYLPFLKIAEKSNSLHQDEEV